VANELVKNGLQEKESVERQNEYKRVGENHRVVAKEPLDNISSEHEMSSNEHLQKVICAEPISATRSSKSFSDNNFTEPELLIRNYFCVK